MSTLKHSNPAIKNGIILAVALAIGLAVTLIPAPGSLIQTITTAVNPGTTTPSYAKTMHSGGPAMAALGVMSFALILWITEALPFHITGLLSLIFLTLLKVGKYKEIISTGFGNDIVVFFIGVLVITAFITKSGLGKRISAVILSIDRKSVV